MRLKRLFAWTSKCLLMGTLTLAIGISFSIWRLKMRPMRMKERMDRLKKSRT